MSSILESSGLLVSPSDINPPQALTDPSMPSFFGGASIISPLSFGCLSNPFDNSPAAAADKVEQPRPDSRPRINTQCGPFSTPSTPDLSASTPAISLDRYFVTWLTQLWLSHWANPNLPGGPHVQLSDARSALNLPDLPSTLMPSVRGETMLEEPDVWMRHLSQYFGEHQPFA